MKYEGYLQQLLAPLRVYDLSEGTFNGAELACEGAALDAVQALLEQLQREMNLTTAQDTGLEKIAELLSRRPVAGSTEQMRGALAALLRVNGDSFTLSAVNDNITGCGINAVVRETGQSQTVEVSFPDVNGVPEGFDAMRKIIEDIIPCHLQIDYFYFYLTWADVEGLFGTWDGMEACGCAWNQLGKLRERL